MSDVENTCFNIEEFCKAHRISRAMLYKLWNQGLGPRTMRTGKRVLITVEAAAEWRRENEARTQDAVA
jgi:hypothetical protein